jgi:MHS family shikimate/dehydroshikimate transporter-like MFS transporter
MKHDTAERQALIEAVVASTVGTTIEWYDFFLRGTAAALVFRQLFFPEVEPFVGLILSLGTFSFGFVARPIGGVIFGYMGDRVGRKSTLVATLLLMGVSTVLIGCLPTYEQVGVAAPLMLTGLSFLQGLGVGGEWGGAVLMALEYSQPGKRGFHASWPQTGVPLGLLLSTLVVALMQGILSEADFVSWGWRVPFLLSAVLIGVGFAIRARIHETPLFLALKARRQVAEAPLRETLRRHWRQVLLAAGARLAENACFYLFSIYVIVYARDALELDAGVALHAVLMAAALEFVAMPLFGMLSDFWSRKGMYIAGCLFLMLFAFPYLALLETREPALVQIAIVLSLVGGHAILYSVQASLIPELFGTRVRCTGASLGYQLAAPIGGGLAPLIAAGLVEAFPQQYWPLALYIMLVAAISLTAVYFLAETSRKDLSAES